MHFPVWPTSPIWHLCRRKQSMRRSCWYDMTEVTLKMFSLCRSDIHIYLRNVDNVCTMNRSFICVSIQPCCNSNVHMQSHWNNPSFAQISAINFADTDSTHNPTLTPVGKTPLAEWQKHSTELVIYCLYNWYVWIKSNEMSFIYYSNFVSNYYLT